MTNQNIQHVDFLKVNIEGAEIELIENFNKIDIIKNVAISCHDFLGARTGKVSLYTKDQVSDFLRDHGFAITTLNTPYDYANDWVFSTRNSSQKDEHA